MASPALNFVTFNQDHSCLAVGECPTLCRRPLPFSLWIPATTASVCRLWCLSAREAEHATIYRYGCWLRRRLGTSKGFRIYHTEPFSKIFSSDDGSVSIIEMLFSTSLVAVVLSPRHLIIQNTKVW